MQFDVFDFGRKINDKAELLIAKADKCKAENRRPYVDKYETIFTIYCQAYIDVCTDKLEKAYMQAETERQLMIITDHVEAIARRHDIKAAREHLERFKPYCNPRLEYLLRVVSDDDLLLLEKESWYATPDAWTDYDDFIDTMCGKYSIPVPHAQAKPPAEPVPVKKRRGRPRKEKS